MSGFGGKADVPYQPSECQEITNSGNSCWNPAAQPVAGGSLHFEADSTNVCSNSRGRSLRRRQGPAAYLLAARSEAPERLRCPRTCR